MKTKTQLNHISFISALSCRLWGVLLVFVFALIPMSASAYNNNFVPSTNTDLRFTSQHSIQGGCMFATYNLANGFNPFLGQLLDGTHNCGYRYVNDHISYYSSNSVGYSSSSYNGSSFMYTTDTYGGYNILNSWSQSVIASHGRNAYNTLGAITLNFRDCGGSCNGFNLRSTITGHAIFVYAYKPHPDTLGSVGTIPRINTNGTGFSVLNADGTSYNDTDFINHFAETISNSIVYGSFSYDQLNELLPPELFDFNLGDEYMYIIGAIPIYPDKYLSTDTLQFVPELATAYGWKFSDGTMLDKNGFFNFLSYNPSNSYYNYGTGISQFTISDVKFGISLCTTQEECDNYDNFVNMYHDAHYNDLLPSSSGAADPSIFKSWFDVFNISFVFPFRAFFSSFSNDSCVNIPIIANMLNATSNQYCTWWSSDIRNITTPVFTMFGLMVLTGFIIHWLCDKQTSITVTGGSA